jgi:hypothetical protein
MSKVAKGCLGGLSGCLLWLFSGQLGCVGIVIGLALLYFLAYAIVKAVPLVFLLIRILLLIGVLFGLAITVRNYALALYHNIKPEKVTS